MEQQDEFHTGGAEFGLGNPTLEETLRHEIARRTIQIGRLSRDLEESQERCNGLIEWLTAVRKENEVLRKRLKMEEAKQRLLPPEYPEHPIIAALIAPE